MGSLCSAGTSTRGPASGIRSPGFTRVRYKQQTRNTWDRGLQVLTRSFSSNHSTQLADWEHQVLPCHFSRGHCWSHPLHTCPGASGSLYCSSAFLSRVLLGLSLSLHFQDTLVCPGAPEMELWKGWEVGDELMKPNSWQGLSAPEQGVK